MRGLAGFLFLTLLASCAPPATLPGPPPPLPAPEAERGIGGTGAPNGTLDAERGIGGTGIIGVITGFGSIFVDGLEVRYGAGTEVSVDDASATPAALRKGQVVAVSAVGPRSGLVAESISVVHEVAGPVQAVEDGGRMVRVAGQEVVIQGAIPDEVGGGGLAPGDWVAVSGLKRPDGAIVATRIDPSPAGLVRVRGPLAAEPFARFGPRVGRVFVESYVTAADGHLSMAGGPSVRAPAGMLKQGWAVLQLERGVGAAPRAVGASFIAAPGRMPAAPGPRGGLAPRREIGVPVRHGAGGGARPFFPRGAYPGGGSGRPPPERRGD